MPIDMQKQIAYWRDGAVKDMQVGGRLIERDKEILHGLFFAQLALEKALKAHVCKHTSQIPPRTHKLAAHAQLGNVRLSQGDSDFLAAMETYQLEGRYPEIDFSGPSLETAMEYLRRAQEMVKWLTKQL